MAAFGGEIVTGGKDFDESRSVAAKIQSERGYHFVPSFHRDLVKGVATYAHELFESHADLDVVYVPIGMGSGISGLITVRDLLGLRTEIVGVVADNAPAFALSFAAGHPVQTNAARTFADGVACRDPPAQALEIIKQGAARVVRVSEDEIAQAIRIYYTTTHSCRRRGRRAARGAAAGEHPLRRQAGGIDPFGRQYRYAAVRADPARRDARRLKSIRTPAACGLALGLGREIHGDFCSRSWCMARRLVLAPRRAASGPERT